MRILRLLGFLGALTLVAGAAYVRQADESSGAATAGAAARFLDSLSAEQRAKAAFAFDAEERLNLQFMKDRADKSRYKGLPVTEMTAEQKKAALELLKAGTSRAGNDLAVTLMSLEALVPK